MKQGHLLEIMMYVFKQQIVSFWNLLPQEIEEVGSVNSFKKRIRQIQSSRSMT